MDPLAYFAPEVKETEGGHSGMLAWYLLSDGKRKMLVIVKLGRDQEVHIAEPTEEQMASVRDDAWEVWNAGRC